MHWGVVSTTRWQYGAQTAKLGEPTRTTVPDADDAPERCLRTSGHARTPVPAAYSRCRGSRWRSLPTPPVCNAVTIAFDLRYPDQVQGQELGEGVDGHLSMPVVKRDELWWLDADRCTP